MANDFWSKSLDKNEQQTAYIDGYTQALAETDPYISNASNLLLDEAKKIMSALALKGITPHSKTKSGQIYPSKATVHIEQAEIYNRDTKTVELLERKDGSPVYSLQVAIPSKGSTLTLYAKDNIEDGIKFTAMSAKIWEQTDKGGVRPKFISQDKIADSKALGSEIKSIAKSISNLDIIVEKTPTLFDYAKSINEYFEKACDKVPSTATDEKGALTNLDENGQPKQVPDAYAKYINDDYGETIKLASHSNKVVVELGYTGEDRKPYVKATNFDIEAGKTNEGKPIYATAFLNTKKDMEGAIECKEIRQIALSFKGLDKEKEKAAPNKNKKEQER